MNDFGLQIQFIMKNIRRRSPSLARRQHVTDLPVQRKRWSARASPPHHTATVTQQLLFFSNHSLLVSWLIIHHLRGKQRAFMYTTPVAVFIRRVSGLPQHFHVCPLSRGESYRQPHVIAGSPSFAVRVVYSSHSALLCFHQMSPLVLDFGFFLPFIKDLSLLIAC